MINVDRITDFTDGTSLATTKAGRRYAIVERDSEGPIWALVRRFPKKNPPSARSKAKPRKKAKARKRNPLGIPTPQGIALHLVGSKLLRKKNPGYTQHGATEDLFGGASRATPRHHSDVSRPRVKVHGGTVTFAEGSPYKGKVRKANPVPKVVRKPLVLVLTQAESKAINGGGSSVAMVRKAFAAAKESGKDGWDHIVVEHPGGQVAFTLIP